MGQYIEIQRRLKKTSKLQARVMGVVRLKRAGIRESQWFWGSVSRSLHKLSERAIDQPDSGAGYDDNERCEVSWKQVSAGVEVWDESDDASRRGTSSDQERDRDMVAEREHSIAGGRERGG